MNKAFIFDMDGVLVDSEPVWEELEREYLPKIFGTEIFAKMGSLVGIGINDVVERARELGSSIKVADYARTADEMASIVYARAPVTKNIDTLVTKLALLGFRLGVVSQSPHQWIDQVTPRLSFKDKLDIVVSLHDHPELERKPAPDGFLYACAQLGALPAHSVVLEDSNRGIESGKAAGCYTVGYRGNLIEGYEQTGADDYANTMDDVIALVETFSTQRSPTSRGCAGGRR